MKAFPTYTVLAALFCGMLNSGYAATPDTASIKRLTLLSKEYKNDKPALAMQYADSALKLAMKKNWMPGIAAAYNSQGDAYACMANSENSLDCYQKSLSIYRSLKDRKNESMMLDNIGTAYGGKSDFYKGLEYNLMALKLAKEINYTEEEARALFLSAQMYQGLGNYTRGLDVCFEALTLGKKAGALKMYSSIENCIGGLYYDAGQMDNAAKYFKDAADDARKYNKDRRTELIALSNLGNVLFIKRKFNEALEIQNQCKDFFKTSGNKYLVAQSLVTIAHIKSAMHKKDEALQDYREALEIDRELNKNDLISLTMLNIACVEDDLKNNKSALEYAHGALHFAELANSPKARKDAYKVLYLLYDNYKNLPQAYYNYKKFISLSDSLLNKDKEKEIVRKEMQYSFDMKEMKAKAEQAKRDAVAGQQLRNEKLRRNAYLGGGALLGLLSLSLFTAYRRNKRKNFVLSKQKHEIEQKNNEKELLLRELHHRIKNNLQIVSGLLSLQSGRMTDEQSAMAFKEGQSRVEAMALIHHKLYLRDNLTTVDIKEYMESLLAYLMETYGYSTQTLKIEEHIDSLELDIDIAIPLGLVLNEIISNCFKHAYNTIAEPYLLLEVKTKENNELRLTIADNGTGITDNMIEKSNSSFGMKMITSLIKQLHGNLQRTNNDGTRYELIIPMQRINTAG